METRFSRIPNGEPPPSTFNYAWDIATRFAEEQFASSASPAKRYRNRFTLALLILSGLGLWGSAAVMAGALLFGGQGDRAINQLFDLFTFAAPAAAVGVVLFVVYTIIQQPWRAGRGSIAFVLQIPFVLGVLLLVLAFFRDTPGSH
ncbi:hypothetical protein SB783_31565 [Paraburkholderia sp. SIMBA_009]